MNQLKNLVVIIGSLFIFFILSACGPSQAELDATATQAAVAMFATQTAEAPTATLTPTRTPTLVNTPTDMPTETASPTATLPPSQTPEPTAIPTTTQSKETYIRTVNEDGWQNLLHEGLGFRIAVPPTWIHLDLTVEDLEELHGQVIASYPQLEGIVTLASLQGMVDLGAKLVAMDPDPNLLAFGTSMNLNVMVIDLPFDVSDVSIHEIVEGFASNVKSNLGEHAVLQQEIIMLGDMEAGMIEYQEKLMNPSGQERTIVYLNHMMLDGRTVYILTLVAEKDPYIQNKDLIEDIVGSFRLVK